MKRISHALLVLLSIFVLANCDSEQSVKKEAGFKTERHVEMNPSYEPLPIEESLKRFRLPEGYHLEIVAAEPMISEPAVIAWDGNGRMYVAQLESYMQTIDAKGEGEPISRIVRLEDTDDDGRMDKRTVFIDSLVSPRMLLCVGNEVFVNETNTFDIIAYKDENDDGIADKKRIVYSKPFKAYGNIEHQRSGFDWNIDNHIYVTTDLQTYRYRNGMLVADSLAYGNNGQWGLTHDDFGRLYFSLAASSVAASGFHVNPEYGQLDIFDEKEEAVFRQVWPGVKTPDANAALRDDSTLIVFTASCGQSVYRGDRLPASMYGDYFVCEPVGRLVRRAKITDSNGIIKVKNVYDKDEFLTTSDFNFRPVSTYTGPDGCLYIVDMYRGIIQESEWVRPGMAIYDQVRSKGLDKNIRRGRIYRLVHDGIKRGPRPTILDDPSDKLVACLGHPNGWWRDNAQKELIVRGDVSVIPALKKLFKNGSSLGRLHALWTIDGLDKMDKETVLTALNDADPQIRKSGIRISEKYISGDEEILNKLLSMEDDSSKEVTGQLLLTLNQTENVQAHELIERIFNENESHKLISGIRDMLAANEEKKQFGAKLVALNEDARKRVIRGSEIFSSLCVTCHGPKGTGLPARVAPPLIGKIKLLNNREALIKILLSGLKGPVEGVTYPGLMVSMKSYDDEWIASVLNYVRFDLTMQSFPVLPSDYLQSLMITPQEVNKMRKQTAGRNGPWTWEELLKK
jgi:glucose/arabinose dehydrogenase/mono/diheme cytochrome c family protein